jgi:hypothetical protein
MSFMLLNGTASAQLQQQEWHVLRLQATWNVCEGCDGGICSLNSWCVQTAAKEEDGSE